MKKCFVLSTRTVLTKRNVTLGFDSDNMVVIPMVVVEQIQNEYSHLANERGKIAREFLDYLWSFDFNELKNGVKQENGSILRLVTNYNNETLNVSIQNQYLDSFQKRILQVCFGLNRDYLEYKVVLVSKNVALRMKAKMMGIEAQNLKDELLPELSEQYTGREKLCVSQNHIAEFYEKRKIEISAICKLNPNVVFYENMFVVMKADKNSAIGRVEGDYIIPLVYDKFNPYGVMPKNVGQKFLIEALMMDYDRSSVVLVKGPAGTAKTFISLAVGLELQQQNYFPKNILISRSPTETGEKIGYLPGDEEDKMGPYMRGIYDNLEQLINGTPKKSMQSKTTKSDKNKSESFEKNYTENGRYFFEGGIIKLEAIGFIRGRSICDTYIIIDEAQNLTPMEMKTIITRLGEGSKLVIIGDPEQIDRPELSERNNGLSYACERLKGESFCWQITMNEEESVRSLTAKRAVKLL